MYLIWSSQQLHPPAIQIFFLFVCLFIIIFFLICMTVNKKKIGFKEGGRELKLTVDKLSHSTRNGNWHDISVACMLFLF